MKTAKVTSQSRSSILRIVARTSRTGNRYRSNARTNADIARRTTQPKRNRAAFLPAAVMTSRSQVQARDHVGNQTKRPDDERRQQAEHCGLRQVHQRDVVDSLG